MTKRTDLRRLTHQELTEMRKQVVAQIQSGISVEQAAEVFGISRSAIFGWLARYRAGGWDALRAGKRGGRRPKVSAEDMQWLYEAITQNTPEQYQMPFALWTLKQIEQLLKKERGIELSRWSVSRLLKQLGLTPQRPLRRAWQQDPEAVERWKAEDYPEIQKQARAEGGVIYFLDESAVRSDHHAGTTWAPKGETPVVKATGARFSLNIVGAISAQGEFRFMTYTGTMNAQRFIEFLRRLLRDETRPIHLVVDGHPVHRAKAVQRFVARTDGRLKIHVLPGYSPELNPIEQVWNHVKNDHLGRKVIAGPNHLKRLSLSALRRMQKTPELIAKFFWHPECRYTVMGV